MKKTLLFLLILLAGCAPKTKEEQLARAFIDAYYVMAAPQAALPLTKDLAFAKIQNELTLLESTPKAPQDYKSRAVEFTLKKETSTPLETKMMYHLILHPTHAEAYDLNVVMVIDRENQKIIYFGEIQ